MKTGTLKLLRLSKLNKRLPAYSRKVQADRYKQSRQINGRKVAQNMIKRMHG